MTTRYAENTSVPVDRSRSEIEKQLQRFGATGLGEVLGRGVMAEDVPLLAELLTPAGGPEGT